MRKAALILILFCGVFGITARAAEAVAYLTVSPTSGNYNVDGTFAVTLGVNSGGESIGGVDGLGTYDSAKLELTSIATASDMVFLSSEGGGACSIDKTVAAGKFSYSCYTNNATGDKAVSGSLVTLTFKAKATGTATLNYTCAAGSTTDSNIVKSGTVTDIVTCTSNQSGSYTIGSGTSTSTDTTTNTPTPTTASGTTVSELPKTGAVGTTLGLIVFGIVSLGAAVFLKFL